MNELYGQTECNLVVCSGAGLGVARLRILETLGLEYGILFAAGLAVAALGAWTVVVVFEGLLGWMG